MSRGCMAHPGPESIWLDRCGILSGRPGQRNGLNLGAKWAQNLPISAQMEGWLVSKGSRINVNFAERISGAGDGNRTNPNEPNKGVTTRSTVQLESNGVNSSCSLTGYLRSSTHFSGYRVRT
jgi:hypothetical protein